MQYRVRLDSETAAEDIVTGLWGQSLFVRGDPRRKYRWYYRDNPVGKGSTFLLEDDGDGDGDGVSDGDGRPGGGGAPRVVGCAGVGQRLFYRGGVPLRAALMADFAVDRQHRTVMPALLLQREVRRHVQEHYDLAYGFPNASAVGIFRRIGYKQLGCMARYVRPLRVAPLLRRLVSQPLLVRVGGGVGDGVLSALGQARGLLLPGELRLEWLADADGRFDRLWEAEHGRYPLIGYRGADFLRWRFLQHPGERFALAGLVHRRTGALHAYAVVQEEDGRAHVRDLFGTDLGVLLERLAIALRRRGMDAISTRFLGAGWMVELLRRHGFMPREAQRAVIVAGGESLRGEARLLEDPGSWYLTDADEDT